MRLFYQKQDKVIKEAFHIYEQAKSEQTATKQPLKEKSHANDMSATDNYINQYESSKMEDKIYTLIKKIPIKNPVKKAKRIHIAAISVVLLFILFLCLLFFKKDTSARYTKVIQDIYRSSDSIAFQSDSVILKDNSLYLLHPLSEKAQTRLAKEGENLNPQKRQSSTALALRPDAKTTKKRAYRLFDRRSRQYILVWDEGWSLGKFIGYAMTTGDSEDKNAGFLDVCAISSAKDLRTVSLERTTALSKEQPDKRVAIWNRTEQKRWFYRFFKEKKKMTVQNTGGGQKENDSSEKTSEQISESTWENQVKTYPKDTFYLALENKLHEILLFGVILKEDRLELWLEPLSHDLLIKQKTSLLKPSASDGKKDTVYHAYRLFLSEKEQKTFAKILHSIL